MSVVVPEKGSKGKNYAVYHKEKSAKAKLKIAVDTLIPQVNSFEELLSRLQGLSLIHIFGSCLNEIVLVIPNIREYPLQIGKDKFFDNILTDIMGGTYKIISRSVAVVATSIGVFALRRSCTTNEV